LYTAATCRLLSTPFPLKGFVVVVVFMEEKVYRKKKEKRDDFQVTKKILKPNRGHL